MNLLQYCKKFFSFDPISNGFDLNISDKSSRISSGMVLISTVKMLTIDLEMI
jgi:hypothetical protein